MEHNETAMSDQMEGCVVSNQTNLVAGESAEVEEWTSRIFGSVLIPPLFFVGAPGNLLNLLVFYRQGLQVRINLCLFSLALADLMVNCGSFVFYAERFASLFSKYERFSHVFVFITAKSLHVIYGFSYVSFIITAIVAVERCWSIARPLQAHAHLTTKSMAVVLSLIFVSVIGLYYVSAASWSVACFVDGASGVSRVTFTGNDFYTSNRVLVDVVERYLFGLSVLCLCLPVVIATTLITSVKLRQSLRWRENSAPNGQSRKEAALTKMLIGTSILFIVCLTPFCFFMCLSLMLSEFRTGGRHHNIIISLSNIAEFFFVVNSSITTFIYYSFGSRYREEVQGMCFCRRKRGRKRGEGIIKAVSRGRLPINNFWPNK